jgi:hypothetical protein
MNCLKVNNDVYRIVFITMLKILFIDAYLFK